MFKMFSIMTKSTIDYLQLAIILLAVTLVQAQKIDDTMDLLLIREDKVSPSMSNDYELSLADLHNFLVDNKVIDFNYFTHIQDDYKFTHIVPIDNLDDLHSGTREALQKKINKPELEVIMNYFDLSVDSYLQYIVQYRPKLSYVLENDNWMENSSYRKWNYFYFYPGNETEVEELLAAYKYLYEQKSVEMGFRVFKGLIGTEKPLYILTTWGASPLDYHESLEKASKSLGDEGAVLWTNLMKLVRETKTSEGWYLPQYSYSPDKKLAE
jgi:hypothetical protein